MDVAASGTTAIETNGTSAGYTWNLKDLNVRPKAGQTFWETAVGQVTDLAGNAVPAGLTDATVS